MIPHMSQRGIDDQVRACDHRGMTHHDSISTFDLSRELSSTKLGDVRLSSRLQKIAERLQADPGSSFPQIMQSEAELEAFYRFIANDRVSMDALVAAHVGNTAQRAQAAPRIVVAHDTTRLDWAMPRVPNDVGYTSGTTRGFFLHASLAMRREDPGTPLGLLSLAMINRPEPRKPRLPPRDRAKQEGCESLKWLRGVQEARKQVGQDVNMVHVMDREGDDYKLFSQMINTGEAFVIRVCHDRILTPENTGEKKMYKKLSTIESIAAREVPLSKRMNKVDAKAAKIHPRREARLATLCIRATSLTLRRPRDLEAPFPNELPLNVVHVFEPSPPDGEAPIDWKLFTTLPVHDVANALEVVDIYRQRWMIEEYFKALKTGTALKSRQVESLQAMKVVLGLALPLAWRLLGLRTLARQTPNAPATLILSQVQIDILRALGSRPISKEPTLEEVSYATAALAGHLKANGPPGWATLAAGLEKLLLMERVWLAAKREEM